jgi:hypothetical protein
MNHMVAAKPSVVLVNHRVPVKPSIALYNFKSFGIKDPIPAAIILTPRKRAPRNREKPISAKRKENNKIAAAKSRANRKSEAVIRENTIALLRRENAYLLQKLDDLTQTVISFHQIPFPVMEPNPAHESWADSILD